MEPIERELGIRSSPEVGRSHAQQNRGYNSRIDAVNYSLLCDDGQGGKNLRESDVILVGVSRCGKTPTCLFLAMQYGIKAANYPLIPEDLERMRLPESLENFHKKLFGLTIMPNRLSSIRQERRPNSVYASLENCQNEVRKAEALVSQLGIPFLDTTTRSIEEVAAFILQKSKLKRRTF